MLCNKCRQTAPADGDSWCLGCSAIESLQTELNAHWHHPGLRKLANDQVVAATRAVRALRLFSSGLKSAGDARAALPRHAGRASEGQNRSGDTRPRSLPPPPPPPIKEQEVSEEEEESEEEEDTEEAAPEATPKSDPSRRPPEPDKPPRSPESSRDRRRHQEEASKRKRREGSDKKRRRRGDRGGKKHPRVYRTLDNPDLPVHRRLPPSFLDSAPSLGSSGSRARR